MVGPSKYRVADETYHAHTRTVQLQNINYMNGCEVAKVQIMVLYGVGEGCGVLDEGEGEGCGVLDEGEGLE